MRQRSIKVDVNDENALINPYGGQEMNMDSEFGQHVPMFFNREGGEVEITGQYRGASIFFICNGPSFVKLNHDLLKLPGVMTFGINNGPRTFRPNFWTSVDDPSRFLKSIWLDPKISKFIPQNHFESHIWDNEKWAPSNIKVGECPNIIGYRRNEKFNATRWMKEHTLNWGNHKQWGGGRSVMLPALRIMYMMGFRKVYLLGCDMKMSQEFAYHFDEQRSSGATKNNNNTYDRLKEEYLPQLKPIFDKEGFQVFNCNLESNLKVFPFVSFEDAINDATKALGDVPNERVWGMYSKPEEKMKWKQEPTVEFKPHLQTLSQLKNGQSVSQVLSSPKPKTQPIYVKDDCDPAENTCNRPARNDESLSPNLIKNAQIPITQHHPMNPLAPAFKPIPPPQPFRIIQEEVRKVASPSLPTNISAIPMPPLPPTYQAPQD